MQNNLCLDDHVFLKITEKYMVEFASLKDDKILKGDWFDFVWVYKSLRISFDSVDKILPLLKNQDECVGVVSKFGVIARCMLVKKANENLSKGSFASLFFMFKFVIEYLNRDYELLVSLNGKVVDGMLNELRSRYSLDSTFYNKAGILNYIVDFLNDCSVVIEGEVKYLLKIQFSWKHKVSNPIHRIIDVTTEEFEKHSEKKYPENIAKAFSHIFIKLKNNPELDYKFMYSIRMDCILFMVSLGLRIGEVLSLSVDCLQYDERTEKFNIKIWSEKSSTPRLCPVPDVWAGKIKNTFDGLVEKCQAAREFSKEIEENGFSFIKESLFKYRCENPLSNEKLLVLNVLNKSPEEHIYSSELIEMFDITKKNITAGGEYNRFFTKSLQLTAARLIKWFDERFKFFDWGEFICYIASGRRAGSYGISNDKLALYTGILRGSLKNIKWAANFVEKITNDLYLHGVFYSASADPLIVNDEIVERLRTLWLGYRKELLKCNDGNAELICNTNEFTDFLASNFYRVLSNHYDEIIDDQESLIHKSTVAVNGYIANQPLSQHLFVVWENQFNSVVKGMGLLSRPISRSNVYSFLTSSNDGRSIFEKFDIKDDKGQFYSLSSHMIRHWVTTAVLRAGMSEMLADIFMGRTLGQSRIYDHRTGKERAEFIREKELYLSQSPPPDWLGNKISRMRDDGYTEKELENLVSRRLQILHFTPWGFCSRDLTNMPCTKGISCLRGFSGEQGCEHFHIDLNDNDAFIAINKLHEKTKIQLKVLLGFSEELTEKFVKSVGNSTPLDQHTKYLIDVLSGCEAAILAYGAGLNSGSEDNLIKVFVRKNNE